MVIIALLIYITNTIGFNKKYFFITNQVNLANLAPNTEHADHVNGV